MAKKKGFDFKQVGRFLFQKGERIGLAVSAVIMVLLIVLGVMAGASSQDWGKLIGKEAKNKTDEINRAEPPPGFLDDERKNKVPTEWPALAANAIPNSVLWFNLDESVDNKRRNPYAMKISDRPMQVDFVRGTYYAYDVDFNKGEFGVYVADGVKPVNLTPARTVRPKRGMVVVSAVFPYKEQLEVFRKQLRFSSISELIARPDDMPKFLGLIVVRSEVLPSGAGPDVPIFTYDGQSTKVGHAGLEAALKESIYQTVPAELREFIHPGLVTPLPEMAVGTYPAVDLEATDIKVAAISPLGVTPAVGNPNMAGQVRGQPPLPFNFGQPPPAGEQARYSSLQWVALQKPLQEKFAGKFNFFDPNEPTGQAGAVPFQPGVQPGIIQPGIIQPPRQGGEGVIGGGQEGAIPEKILVRFFDVDLEPGKTYFYKIRVRLHNPNFGKEKEVSYTQLAHEKEFVSEVTVTPTVTVPPDYGYYALDQNPDSKASGVDSPKDFNFRVSAERAPVQIHRWTDKENNNLVGDWVVAERLMVRKGEPIGRSSVITEVAEWNAVGEHFEIGSTTHRGKPLPGVPVNFVIGNPPPVLVDFVGGKRDYRDDKIGKLIYGINDEAELEMLILAPNGKLIVRSSAIDGNSATPEGKAREEQYNQWRDRLRMLRGGLPDDKKGPANFFPGNS